MKVKKYSSKSWQNLYPDFFVFKRINARNDIEHIHDFIEIVYIINGEAVEAVNGNNYLMKKGDLLIMNYGCRHTIKNAKNLSYFNVLLYCNSLNKNRMYFQKSFLGVLKYIVDGLPQSKNHEKIGLGCRVR